MKIWQATDDDGSMYTYFGQKPHLQNGKYQRNGISRAGGFAFPIPLKPLQIAEITVCADGTWSYEIEREEGVYMAKNIVGDCFFAIYERGDWRQKNTGNKLKTTDGYTFSPTRIPDECII